MNTIIRPSSHEEWLQVRQSGIGSSEIATIVGLNPWETPYQLWRRKMGIDEPKEETFAMKAGHYLEDAVSMFFHDETGNEIIKSSAGDWIIRDNERPFLQVSPDRTFWLKDAPHNKENKGILECKTTQMRIDGDDIPKHWFCQLQMQLGVAGLTHGALAWLSSGREFGYKTINFVPSFYQWLTDEAEKFWNDYVVARVEPPVTDVRDALMKYGSHVESKCVEVSDEQFSLYQDLRDVKSKIKALEEQKEMLENSLKMLFKDADSLSYCGQTIATWKASSPRRSFDAKAFIADHPDMYEPYMKEGKGSRTFLLKTFYHEPDVDCYDVPATEED